MNRPSTSISPICFSYILVLILLFESTRPVQSIALSSLCASYGHSCFGGNWGRRELSAADSIQSNSDINEGGTAISDEKSINDFLLDQIRLKFFRQRLSQLFEME